MRISGASLTAVLAVFAALGLLPSPVAAQQTAADCADIKDDRQRLACFDRFHSGAAEGDAGASDTSSSTDVRPTATDSERERREAEQARREAEQARRERDRRNAPESETPEERFGMEKKVLELGGDEISSAALGQFDFWNKGQRVELENGQVWEITNSTNLFHKTRNPKVTIEKGLFSSFYMHIKGVSKSLKVRRIR